MLAARYLQAFNNLDVPLGARLIQLRGLAECHDARNVGEFSAGMRDGR